mmetsp:Transcript_9933/g.14625  ORF Transcript_9933/g.14625 Transcript_9933/m.14625 type:complete len:89 (+) Transcript_9933:55-321(+)|eukprot:CAMPEP_0194209110 /NCGR_PEP_ID=MMETSP0156-20130528/7350_1 /TAXON_ID=33649 /ORGANISM="Thalassionema nitzschioides, Strain L26-B" /LENGTH=88 /DNA_ID=CAMNT_0038936213 /DNA_START=45 /DNA_END=311 /DNA_ORIENTATION=-
MEIVEDHNSNVEKSVSFKPFVTVRKFTPISDPLIKEQLYYSQNDLFLIKRRAKLQILRKRLDHMSKIKLRARQNAIDFTNASLAAFDI